MHPNLQALVEALEQAGELVRIKTPVSPLLEVAAITDRVSKSDAPHPSDYAKTFDPKHFRGGGKALLFENVEGSAFPLLINAFGSYRRLEMALGCHPGGPREGGFEAIGEIIGKIAKPEPPVGLIEKIKKGLELAKIAGAAPKVVRSGACQEVVKQGDEIDLLSLPIIQCWPLDGEPRKVGYPVPADQPKGGTGRYITLAGVYTIHPDDAGKDEGQPRTSRNIGMYRCQVIDRHRTAMHWHMHHDGARHWRAWKERRANDPAFAAKHPGMPCAVVLGGESVLPYAATAPMPPGISELLLAGILNDGAIPLVRCKTL
ncbi:MAG: UbiD family decarboxylase, partial [Phycisphaeraceae bacterium]|nr:UbiD family decarboxylase [Phycisphaeraceae bacterium]